MRIQQLMKKSVLLSMLLASAACSQATKTETGKTAASQGVAQPAPMVSSLPNKAPVKPAATPVSPAKPSVDSTQAAEFYVGTWEPVSNSYQGMGRLKIDGQSGLHWHKCKTSYVEHADSSKPGLLLALSADSTCTLDDQPKTKISLVRVAKLAGKCDMNVSAYANAEDARKDRPSAVGMYARAGCQ